MNIRKDGGLYLSQCKVNNIEVKDSKEEDGYYHYGKRDLTNKETINMYGNAIKKAIKDYYEKNNTYPNNISELTLDYSGENISCDVEIYGDGSIYMTKCIVSGIEIKDDTEDGYYHYGTIKYGAYKVGDIVTYNQTKYYVLKNSDDNINYVTLLRKEPLLYDDLLEYSSELSIDVYKNLGFENKEYGIVAFGSSNAYELSNVKKIIDLWAEKNIPEDVFVQDDKGYTVRLITINELENLFGYISNSTTEFNPSSNGDTPNWIYGEDYYYWTMSPVSNNNMAVWYVNNDGKIKTSAVYDEYWHQFCRSIRPVVTIKKNVLN